MVIQGDRVILTSLSINDLDFICNIECNSDLWFYEESIPSDVAAVRNKYINKLNIKEQLKSYDFIITIMVNGHKIPIGLAQIWNYIESRKSWEIGYVVLPEFRAQGYGCEAAKLLLALAFDKLKAHKVVAMCNANNLHSAQLLERIGMTREAIFKEELFWRNQWTDQYYYSILETEFALS